MNTNDISVDCETLGTDYDAPILSIGAVAFDRTTGKLGAKFYQAIDLDSTIKSGRVSGSTLAWWMTQSTSAKAIFTAKETQSLATVLLAFSDWCRTVGKGIPRVWAKGPSADVTWIEHAMLTGGHGLAVPWHYTNVRCVRTIIELAEELTAFDQRTVKNVGIAHNALDDAVYQAKCVSAAYAALRSIKTIKVTRPDDEEL